MRTAPFAYVRAGSVEEAVAALQDGEDARVLAGGQSLVPVMALRLARPDVLVDVSRCEELSSYDLAPATLTVGAAVTDRTLEQDPRVSTAHPLLMRALSFVAHPEIRARGTVCGSLAHADPAAELPAVLLATGGEVQVRGSSGERTVGADDLFLGPFTTALREGELVFAARLPLPGRRSGWAVDEIARRGVTSPWSGSSASSPRPAGRRRLRRRRLVDVPAFQRHRGRTVGDDHARPVPRAGGGEQPASGLHQQGAAGCLPGPWAPPPSW